MGIPPFLAALISAAAHGVQWEQTLRVWRESMAANPRAAEWNAWFDEIEAALSMSVSDAARKALSETTPWSSVMLAVVNILLSPDATPEELFLAHARWLCEIRIAPWMCDVGPAFCILVQRAWSRAIETPALLRHPRLSIPAIRTACEADGVSVSKAARILWAAAGAVSIRISPQMDAAIRKVT